MHDVEAQGAVSGIFEVGLHLEDEREAMLRLKGLFPRLLMRWGALQSSKKFRETHQKIILREDDGHKLSYAP